MFIKTNKIIGKQLLVCKLPDKYFNKHIKKIILFSFRAKRHIFWAETIAKIAPQRIIFSHYLYHSITLISIIRLTHIIHQQFRQYRLGKNVCMNVLLLGGRGAIFVTNSTFWERDRTQNKNKYLNQLKFPLTTSSQIIEPIFSMQIKYREFDIWNFYICILNWKGRKKTKKKKRWKYRCTVWSNQIGTFRIRTLFISHMKNTFRQVIRNKSFC